MTTLNRSLISRLRQQLPTNGIQQSKSPSQLLLTAILPITIIIIVIKMSLGIMQTTPRTKVLFRKINDISNVLAISSAVSSRYLLPSVSNLALIDSIIPPAIVLQMIVSESHRGATDKVADILRELNDPATLVMIFVVPEEIVATFKFPTALPDHVHMYLTVAKPMTLAEARKIK